HHAVGEAQFQTAHAFDVQHDVAHGGPSTRAATGAETVHIDVVNGARDRVKHDPAPGVALEIVVLRDRGQLIGGRSGEHAEDGVEVAAHRVDGCRAAGGGGPGPPDRRPAEVPCDQERLAVWPKILARSDVAAGDGRNGAVDRDGVEEIV